MQSMVRIWDFISSSMGSLGEFSVRGEILSNLCLKYHWLLKGNRIVETRFEIGNSRLFQKFKQVGSLDQASGNSSGDGQLWMNLKYVSDIIKYIFLFDLTTTHWYKYFTDCTDFLLCRQKKLKFREVQLPYRATLSLKIKGESERRQTLFENKKNNCSFRQNPKQCSNQETKARSIYEKEKGNIT